MIMTVGPSCSDRRPRGTPSAFLKGEREGAEPPRIKAGGSGGGARPPRGRSRGHPYCKMAEKVTKTKNFSKKNFRPGLILG